MKKIFIALALLFLCSSCINAAVYKGQKVFVKNCVECHHQRQALVASKTIGEWGKLMNNQGKDLAYIHLKDEKAKESWEYFKSEPYSKKAKDLEDFLLEYAKDSGKVPACN